MATKKSDFLDNIKDIVRITTSAIIKEQAQHLVNKAQEVIYQTQQSILRRLFSGAAFLLGFFLIIVSIILLIQEYLDLSPGWSFLLVGAIILISAIIMGDSMKKRQYYKF